MKAIAKLDGSEVVVKMVGDRYQVTDAEGNEKNLAVSSFKRQYKIVEEVVEVEEVKVNVGGNEVVLAEGKGEVVEGSVVVNETPVYTLQMELDRLAKMDEEAEATSVDGEAEVVNGDIAKGNETVESANEDDNALVKSYDESFSVRREGEGFEEWVSRTSAGESDIEIELSIKGSTKVRDSARVAFLENKKAFERSEESIAKLRTLDVITPEVGEELGLLEKDLDKYYIRAKKYYVRYKDAKTILGNLKAIEAQKQADEKEAARVQAESKTDFETAMRQETKEGSNEEA